MRDPGGEPVPLAAGAIITLTPTPHPRPSLPSAAMRLGVLALPLAALLVGCGSVGVTIHNDTDEALTVAGVGAPVLVAAGERVRVDRVKAVTELVATTDAGVEVARDSVPEHPRDAEIVWAPGGTVCYAEADFGSYYSEDPVVLARVELIASLDPGHRLLVSKGPVDAPPGSKLPARARGRAVALVEVPCQAKREGDAILRSWLEVALREIQPDG